MTRWGCVLVWLLFVGCTPALPVYVSEGEPEAIVLATADAVDFWNDAAGYDALTLRVVARGARQLDPFSVQLVGVAYVDDESYAHADSRVVVNRVRIERTIPPERATRALAHELGHALGLGHARDPSNVMTPSADGLGTNEGQRRRVRALLAARAAAWPAHF